MTWVFEFHFLLISILVIQNLEIWSTNHKITNEIVKNEKRTSKSPDEIYEIKSVFAFFLSGSKKNYDPDQKRKPTYLDKMFDPVQKNQKSLKTFWSGSKNDW